METISSKQKKIKATTFLKLLTNANVLIKEFVWSFEILIPNVLDIIYSILAI